MIRKQHREDLWSQNVSWAELSAVCPLADSLAQAVLERLRSPGAPMTATPLELWAEAPQALSCGSSLARRDPVRLIRTRDDFHYFSRSLVIAITLQSSLIWYVFVSAVL